jgi:hypothetical protein
LTEAATVGFSTRRTAWATALAIPLIRHLAASSNAARVNRPGRYRNLLQRIRLSSRPRLMDADQALAPWRHIALTRSMRRRGLDAAVAKNHQSGVDECLIVGVAE